MPSIIFGYLQILTKWFTGSGCSMMTNSSSISNPINYITFKSNIKIEINFIHPRSEIELLLIWDYIYSYDV